MAGKQSILEKFKTTRPSGGGNFIVDGKGVLLVKRFYHDNTYDGQQLTVELRVMSSEKVDVRDLDTQAPINVEPNKPGTTVSYLCQYEKSESAHANAMALTGALAGKPGLEGEEFTDIYKQMADYEAFEKSNPSARVENARGMLVTFETYRKKTKKGVNAGKPFTAIRWAPVSEEAGNSDEAIAERRKQLDAGTL